MRHDSNTPRWTAATALLAAVLWVAQLAGGWEPHYRVGESFRNGQAGPTHVNGSNWETSLRAKAPEGPADSKALPSTGFVLPAARALQAAPNGSGANLLPGRPHARPAIRAPPRPSFSD